MRLFVTRPAPDNRETAAALEALGHAVLLEPLTSVVFLPPPGIAFRPAAILFTSRNGVRAAARWNPAADWRDAKVFAVGEKTAEAAREAGFRRVTAGGGDGAALARIVAGALDPLAGKVLHVAGRDRAVDLEGALAARGFDTVTVEGYAAEAASHLSERMQQAFRDRAVDGIVVFSQRAAAILARLVIEAGLAGCLEGVTVFAISRRAAEPLADLGVAGIRIASNPDAESLVALIGR